MTHSIKADARECPLYQFRVLVVMLRLTELEYQVLQNHDFSFEVLMPHVALGRDAVLLTDHVAVLEHLADLAEKARQ